MTGQRVIIVGGGASGTMLAAHLLRAADSGLRVTLIERERDIGRGVAYGTAEPDHILNTRAGSMSAFPDDPDGFWRWLSGSGATADALCADPFCFVPRRLFANYLDHLMSPWRAGNGQNGGDGRLDVVRGECVDLRATPQGVAVELADGTTHVGRAAVIATGHDLPKHDPGSPYADAWTPPGQAGIRPDDPVLVLGTGLSMVDAVVGLAAAGHKGRVTALSRHGLLPQTHRRTAPLRIDAADVPFGTDLSYLLRWFRRTARWAEARGGDWRDVVDGMRPYTATLWQSLSVEARRRFLRHARTWWDIHRHRMPPESEARLRAAAAAGALELVAGRVAGIEAARGGVEVAFRRKGRAAVETLRVAKVLDCTGILHDPGRGAGGLVAHLIGKGTARADPLGLGLDVDGNCAVVDGAGRVSARVFAIGPVTKGRFWEVMAVPDIRVQCAALARRVAAVAAADGAPARERPARP